MTHGFQTVIDALGVRLYRVAANHGNADAQRSLGIIYDTGRGVPQDDAEAVRWFRLAADQGHADAQFNLGFRYDLGRGVPQDYVEAMRWYRLAADQGHANALKNLGTTYLSGDGVPQDYVQAHMWYSLWASRQTGDFSDNALVTRDIVAGLMTPTQIAEVQRLAHEWDAAHPLSPRLR